jgi:hypothetical protein
MAERSPDRPSSGTWCAVAVVLLFVATGCGQRAPADRAPALAPAPDFEVNVTPDGRTLIGQFEVDKPEGDARSTLAGLDRAFGARDGCASRDATITARWPGIGVVADLNPPVALDDAGRAASCADKASLTLLSVELADSRWHTDVGLNVGDPVARVTELYPGAKPQRDDSRVHGWRLVAKPAVDGDDAFPRGALVASVHDGRVAALIVALEAQDL